MSRFSELKAIGIVSARFSNSPITKIKGLSRGRTAILAPQQNGGTISMKAFVFSIIAVVAAGPAMAELEYGSATQRAGVYFCTSKQGGGAAYNKGLNEWIGQRFATDESFIFRLTLIREEEIESFPRWLKKKYGQYDAEMAYAGSSLKDTCLTREGEHITIDDGGWFACRTNTANYTINLSNLRFLYTSTSGYLFEREKENNESTIQVMIGNCTKID